jgi:WD40 repeat protein
LIIDLGNNKNSSSPAVAPSGRTVAVCDGDNLKVYDVHNQCKLFSLVGHRANVNWVAYSHDGKWIVSCSRDHDIKLWDAASGIELHTFSGHTEAIDTVAFTPDDSKIISGANGKSLVFWNLSRLDGYRTLGSRAMAASKTLHEHPDDPAALLTLGEWYNFCGVWDGAAELLEKARASGAAISPLMLARCYWEQDKTPQAHAEFQKALAQSGDEQEKRYLQLCIDATGQPPATRP